MGFGPGGFSPLCCRTDVRKWSVLKSIEIKNYKSIVNVTVPLGRVNVFIGENGAGKSNILEAIALAGAANARKLDNEFLAARGVRVTPPQLMRPAFGTATDNLPIFIAVTDCVDLTIEYILENDNAPYSKWRSRVASRGKGIDHIFAPERVKEFVVSESISRGKYEADIKVFSDMIENIIDKNAKSDTRALSDQAAS